MQAKHPIFDKSSMTAEQLKAWEEIKASQVLFNQTGNHCNTMANLYNSGHKEAAMEYFNNIADDEMRFSIILHITDKPSFRPLFIDLWNSLNNEQQYKITSYRNFRLVPVRSENNQFDVCKIIWDSATDEQKHEIYNAQTFKYLTNALKHSNIEMVQLLWNFASEEKRNEIINDEAFIKLTLCSALKSKSLFGLSFMYKLCNKFKEMQAFETLVAPLQIWSPINYSKLKFDLDPWVELYDELAVKIAVYNGENPVLCDTTAILISLKNKGLSANEAKQKLEGFEESIAYGIKVKGTQITIDEINKYSQELADKNKQSSASATESVRSQIDSERENNINVPENSRKA
ncbi:MAG: hypothetical protein J0G32_02190 [Alphaproteobacteria bacterium]|nr:hypothetical protein [Alphaproteobacteria bacterium]OJV12228.1 MAG: hypothetical protein BGO27_05780 [Alphaproteobacteria bacterium 33-17]